MTEPSQTRGGPFIQHARRMIVNGYAVVPIPLGTKGPKLPDWQKLSLTQAALPAFITGTHVVDSETRKNVRPTDGIGILTRNTPAVDVDVLNADVALQMEQFIRDNVDDAPLRIGKAPKRLLMFSATTPFPKITSASFIDPANPTDRNGKSLKQRIEVLGDGQQFVAYHTHPETGMPYTWPEFAENPLDVPVLDLPELDEEQARGICREFERLVTSLGWKQAGEGKASTTTASEDLGIELPPAEEDAELQRVRSALAAISADCSRDDYLAILAALRWTGWISAEELARDWAEGSEEDKYNEHDFNRDWKSLKQAKAGRTITLASLYGLAKSAGWDASRAPSEEEKTEAFEELMARAEALTPGNRKARNELISDIAEATLDPMDMGEVAKAIAKAVKVTVRDVRAAIANVKATDHEEPTHASYAKKLLSELEDSTGTDPVGVEGQLWLYDRGDGVWLGKDATDYEIDVARKFDGLEGCGRRTDYLAIANHAYTIAADGKKDFFTEAPVGLACEGRFYSIEDGEVSRERLAPHHRQRVLANVVPKVMPTPKWDLLMATAFEGDVNREQEMLLEEFFGAAILGFAARYERALFMYGKGRAGKGTIMKIIGAILPAEAQSAIPPDRWDREYYLAALAGKRLNTVGEVSEERPVDGATFKTVLGRDVLQARQPNHRTFSFTNTAAHAFTGNYFPASRDHGAEFFSRWLLIEFRNSLIGKEDQINANLANEIIDEELPGVVARLLQGAKRLLGRGRYELTRQHHAMMAKWQHRSSSAVEFIGDAEVCVLGDFPNIETNRLAVFQAYCQWCRDANRKAMGKHKFYEEFEKVGISSMGVRFANKGGGVMLVRGMALRSQLFAGEAEGWGSEDEL